MQAPEESRYIDDTAAALLGPAGLCGNTYATLTPTLSLSEGEGAVSIPSSPEPERGPFRSPHSGTFDPLAP